MNINASVRRHGQQHFFHLPLANRVASLDLLRGLAIFCMTFFHQSLIVHPNGNWMLFAGFLGFISAPLFLAISGMAVTFHERSHHWPLKMIVHGSLIFALSYVIDVLAQHGWRPVWNIFQIIGVCYTVLGLLDYLGYGWRKFILIAMVVMGAFLFPVIRPENGVFPLWPFGLYFLGGYLLAIIGQSPLIRRWVIWGFLIAGLSYFLYHFSWNPPPDRRHLIGFVFILAIIYVLLFAVLTAEKRGFLKMSCFTVLIRWGQYALTLYYMQQFVTITRLKMPLSLPPTLAWMVQTLVLLTLLYVATLFMKRYPFLDLGWLLRQAENKVLKKTPARSFFLPN